MERQPIGYRERQPIGHMDPLGEDELPRPARPPTLAERAAGLVHWIGPRRLAATVVFAVAAGVGGWWLLHAPAPGVERSLPTAARTSVAAATGGTQPAETGPVTAPVATAAGIAVVHVAGAVLQPGLVRVPASARVADAITAAGGPAAGADLDALNLAAIVTDGSRVYVPRVGEVVAAPVTAAGSSTGTAGPVGPIDINTATAEQLDALPGIGPATAKAIVAQREANGPFRTVDDLLDVKGIGPAKLAQFRDLVTV